jgi:hypothetical protein
MVKIGTDQLWIELTDQDLYVLKKSLEQLIDNIKAWFKNKQLTEYSVALIDDRYYETNYICEYGTLKVSKEVFIKLLSEVLERVKSNYTLEEIFSGQYSKYLIESTGELNGYELDTPELTTFDIVLKY